MHLQSRLLLMSLILGSVLPKDSFALTTRISLVSSVELEPFSAAKTDRKSSTSKQDGIVLNQPGLDARQEISNYNRFLDEIFLRMNRAIKRKHLDPMDLKLLPSKKAPRLAKMVKDISSMLFHRKGRSVDLHKVKGWLHGMSTLKRSGDVAIFIHENYRTIQCPFSLGPLELKVSKTIGSGQSKRTKSARATTDLMLGLMDLRIDTKSGKIEITNVNFDEPGEVDIHGNLKRGAEEEVEEEKKSLFPYRLVMSSKVAKSFTKLAKFVVDSSKEEPSSSTEY